MFAEASWCVECKRMAPLAEAVAAAHPDVVFERVDVSAGDSTAADLRVMATPTLIGFAGGAEVGRVTGRRGRDDIEELFAAARTGARPRRSRTEAVLRAGAGALLVLIGILSGPAWPLLGLGAALSGYGLIGLLPRRR